jgi:hypothetical protein
MQRLQFIREGYIGWMVERLTYVGDYTGGRKDVAEGTECEGDY